MPESQQIEWKESWRDEYLKWVCGFANAQGGVLEIGRIDKGIAVGVMDADKLMEDLPNKIRDVLGIVPSVERFSEGGCELVRITVQAYPNPISYNGQYHVRSGSTKQELKGAALDHFLLSRYGRRWDGTPVPGVEVSNLSPSAIENFRKRAAKAKRLSPEALEIDDAALVDMLRLTEGSYLKRAALLLFHSDPERFFTGASVKIGYFESGVDLRYHDEVHGSLFIQVDRTIDLLLTKYFKAGISYQGV